MLRTETPAAVTRGGRILAEHLALDERARALYGQVTARPQLRQRLRAVGANEALHTLLRERGRRGLRIAAGELVDLANAGATHAELALFPAWLGEVVEDLTVGAARAPRLALELAEQACDAEEDALQVAALIAAIEGQETAGTLRTRAAALRRQGAASYALAARLEHDARRLDRGAA